jgi:lysozyme
MRGAGYAVVVTLILGTVAVGTPSTPVVAKNVESIRVFVTTHREINDCGSRPVQISERGKAFIRQHEGLRLTPYHDSTGYAIGYGMHTWQGLPVTLTHPSSVTKADVEEEFDTQLAVYAGIVTRSVCTPLTPPMFDALVSVAWNAGHVNASIVRKVNQGRAVDASDFLTTATTRNRRNRVLVDRRLREYIMFTGDYDLAME